MPPNSSPRPSPVLIGFSILVIGSCVVPVGTGIDALFASDLITNHLGRLLIMAFGGLAFAQYVAVFRCSRWFASLAILLLILIDIPTIFLLIISIKEGGHSSVQQQWIRAITLMTLVYAYTVVLTFRWQAELLNAPLPHLGAEPAKNLKLFDLFAITTFAAGLMAYLAAF